MRYHDIFADEIFLAPRCCHVALFARLRAPRRYVARIWFAGALPCPACYTRRSMCRYARLRAAMRMPDGVMMLMRHYALMPLPLGAAASLSMMMPLERHYAAALCLRCLLLPCCYAAAFRRCPPINACRPRLRLPDSFCRHAATPPRHAIAAVDVTLLRCHFRRLRRLPYAARVRGASALLRAAARAHAGAARYSACAAARARARAICARLIEWCATALYAA